MRLVLIFILINSKVYSQDTIFQRSLPIDRYVTNISTDGKNLYARIGDSIYLYSGEKLKYLDLGALRFSWIKKNDYADNYYWYHAEQIPKIYSAPVNQLKNILPGTGNAFITNVRLNNDLFICYNGNVLEYKINELPRLIYNGKSIRHIYSDGNLRVISTYDGVFSQKLSDAQILQSEGEKIFPYSHGEFTKIGADFYLCQGANLYKYDEEKNKLDVFLNFEKNGQVRQLIEFENNVIVVSLEGLAVLNLVEKKANEPLINDKISRVKKIGSELIAVTKTGAIYRVSKEFKIDKIQTDFSFEDVENINDEIFIGGKSGLYKLNGKELLKLNSSRVFYELHDYKGNLIFSNFNGLFAWINSSPIPIVNNVEFNRYAMNHDQQFFYAGSINGLYIISTKQFDIWLSNQKEMQKFISINKFNWPKLFGYGIISILVIIIITTVIKKRKSKMKLITYRTQKKNFSIEFLNNLIISNNILSVQELANHLNISTIQLNRNLTKNNTTALKVLINCKKEIAQEMYKNGESFEKISKKTGYSIRYIKDNFFKNIN